MKYLLLFITLLVSSVCFAQNDTEQKADSLYVIVKRCLDKNDIDSAIVVQQKLVQLYKRNYGESDETYLTNFANLGRFYQYNKQYQKSVDVFVEVLPALLQLYGDEDEEIGMLYGWMGYAYLQLQQNNLAIDALENAEKIYAKIKTETDDEYLSILNNIGLVYRRQSKFKKAEEIALKILKIDKEKHGEQHTEYAVDLLNISAIYIETYRYNQAIEALHKALIIFEPVYKSHSTEYIYCLSNLASVYRRMAEYDSALMYSENALAKIEELKGKDTYSSVIALQTIGLSHLNLGNYSKAEEYLKKSTYLIETTIGTNNIEYARTVMNLGLLYKKTYAIQKSIEKYEECKAVLENIGESENKLYATNLVNLSISYRARKEYKKAKNMAWLAIKLKESLYDDDNSSIADSYRSLGIIYEDLNKKDSAVWCYQKGLAIQENLSGDDVESKQRILISKASLYLITDNFSQAASYFAQEIELLEQFFGNQHPDYSSSLNTLAYLYAIEDHPKTFETIQKAMRVRKQQLKNLFTYLPADELSNFLAKRAYDNNELAAALLSNKDDEALKGELLNNLLFLKGAVLQNNSDILLAVKKSGDTALQNTYDQFVSLQKAIAKKYSKAKSNNGLEVEILNEKLLILEKKLIKQSSAYRNFNQLFETEWQVVQNRLQNDEAAIEFIRFNKLSKYSSDGFWYAALIMRKGFTQPMFVLLSKEADIQKITGQVLPKNLYENRSNELLQENEVATENYDDKLYQLIWAKIEPFVAQCKTIYYSPDGILHQIAFHALPISNSSILLDKYHLVQQLSLRDIKTNKNQQNSIKNIAIFGGLDYNNAQANTQQSHTLTSLLPDDRGVLGTFGYLKGTLDEAMAISDVVGKDKVKLYTDKEGTEDVLKRFSSNSPQILHLATHGFFLEKENDEKQKITSINDENAFSLANNPLMRGGVVLAGGNKAWKGQLTPNGQEDGILTAYEVVTLDFSNTELVVLSACKTGLGEISGTEGVFGLQRAFKMAGVDKLIMSLWSVPDKETKELMELFYAQYVQTGNARTAFETAQKTMRAKYAPYYWAAFVLVE